MFLDKLKAHPFGARLSKTLDFRNENPAPRCKLGQKAGGIKKETSPSIFNQLFEIRAYKSERRKIQMLLPNMPPPGKIITAGAPKAPQQQGVIESIKNSKKKHLTK